MIKKYIYGLLSSIILLTSCESWLEVKMKDKILENVLFENIDGYNTALNGIYAELNSPDIYGEKLSVGALDVMAQYYDVQRGDHAMRDFGKYEFGQQSYKDMFFTVWSKMYNQLANINLLIENCNRSDAPITGSLKELISGEAYALRGMLHFDILRLYGPCYNELTKNEKVMPYMNSSDRSIQPMLSAEEIMNLVIEDLQKAKTLLLKSDPVIDEGPKNEASMDDVNNALNYRQYRLNYYAVEALLARAYLWEGNNQKALEHAKEVINIVEGEKSWFPFTNKSKVLAEKQPDRIFSTEVLFSLYNTSRKDLYTKLFAKENNVNVRLTFHGDYLEGRLKNFYGDEGDIRHALWKSEMVDTANVLYNSRFAPNNDSKNQYMIPLIRISEMYLIAAECCDSDEDAQMFINKIRAARNALNVTIEEGSRDEYIAKEFAREMMCEGQTFFFYKRKAMTQIPDGHTTDKNMDMPLVNYTWIIPDAELENRPKF